MLLFACVDIFDLPTFAHLAAETAAEYARRPLTSFPPLPRGTASDVTGGRQSEQEGACAGESEIPPADLATAASSNHLSAAMSSRANDPPHMQSSLCASTLSTATIESGQRRPSALSPSSSFLECAFRRFVAEMKAEEVEHLIRSDPNLQRMQRQTASYRNELAWLQKSFEAKLHVLRQEQEQLQQRHEKLTELSQRVAAGYLAQAEGRIRSMSIASDVSSCGSSATSSPAHSRSATGNTSAASSRHSTPPTSPASS